MRSLADVSLRWQETLKHSSSLADLQQAVRENGPESPCVAGCRSVCWKAFLLNQTTHSTNWAHALLESRSSYASLRDHFLKYIKHPEYLTAGTSDPLADDNNSPWITYRLDEVLRAEILQDVQRLPDEPFYHQPHIQALITDVLFIYCKLNPETGGYRQGMHELLAPIVYVVEQDALDPTNAASDTSADLRMVEMLDASFIEHDSFALFSKVMDYAKAFYETGENADNGSANMSSFGMQSIRSSIVDKSQYIHEVCLYKVDPELSNHLKSIEILPQIFLIRWIRLLFSREFPFDQVLILWDTLFSIDPEFKLIDLVCTSMLLRIRWELLEADYAMALQLLLKYPAPQAPNGPHTFISDAFYLRDHLDSTGGSELITKYTGRFPAPPSQSSSSSSTTPRPSRPNLRQNMAAGARSPLSPPRFRPPPGGVEAIFQGAAKNVLEQSERLGINQAVRDAMVEIRRNVQEARSSMKSGKDLFSEPRPNTAIRAVAVMDRRNRRLAAMLEEPIASLKGAVADNAANNDGDDKENDKEKVQNAIELVTAKLQFIKVYLEDSTMALPDEEPMSPGATGRKVESEPLSDAVAAMALNSPMVIDSPDPANPDNGTSTNNLNEEAPKEISSTPPEPDSNVTKKLENSTNNITPSDPLGVETSTIIQTLKRPQPPIPTRSTLAQSSFSWMLEPDSSSSSFTTSSNPSSKSMFPSPSSSSSPFDNPRHHNNKNKNNSSNQHRKRPSSNAARERTAFLFGEVPSDADGNAIREEDIFGLEPIRKS
ncbi:rab-GTPase-TBC domain-containing protein [Xylariaceae sp. FL0255]|nr:rab-GTPase-TBC domain-containing protein [Xylariaceae sp. FL0255]